MFSNGEKVVCINDNFPAAVRALYTELPAKGRTYTVRDCELGRAKMTGDKQRGWGSATWKVLLVEIVNGVDPSTTGPRGGNSELGFLADRFKPLEEVTDSNANTNKKQEPVLV